MTSHPAQSGAAVTFPNPQSEAMEAVLAAIQSVGLIKATPPQVQTLRTLARFCGSRACDYGYGIDALRIYFEDGRRVCVTPAGGLYS